MLLSRFVDECADEIILEVDSWMVIVGYDDCTADPLTLSSFDESIKEKNKDK